MKTGKIILSSMVFIVIAIAVSWSQNVRYTNSGFSPPDVIYRPQTNIAWMGHPQLMYTNHAGSWPGFLMSHEIGFRDDGVVVWRKVP